MPDTYLPRAEVQPRQYGLRGLDMPLPSFVSWHLLYIPTLMPLTYEVHPLRADPAPMRKKKKKKEEEEEEEEAGRRRRRRRLSLIHI
eukprot:12123697-Prorocentrum_lima.AAC.1